MKKIIILFAIVGLTSCSSLDVSGFIRDENTGAKAGIGGGKWFFKAPVDTDQGQTGYIEIEGTK